MLPTLIQRYNNNHFIWVNDNQVDNYLEEIFAFVYYGSIVNNRSRNILSTDLAKRCTFHMGMLTK